MPGLAGDEGAERWKSITAALATISPDRDRWILKWEGSREAAEAGRLLAAR